MNGPKTGFIFFTQNISFFFFFSVAGWNMTCSWLVLPIELYKKLIAENIDLWTLTFDPHVCDL